MGQNLSLNAAFDYSQVYGTTKTNSAGDFYQNYVPAIFQPYQYMYGYWRDNTSNIEKAFKTVKVLLDKKLVKVPTVKDFIDLVTDISKEI